MKTKNSLAKKLSGVTWKRPKRLTRTWQTFGLETRRVTQMLKISGLASTYYICFVLLRTLLLHPVVERNHPQLFNPLKLIMENEITTIADDTVHNKSIGPIIGR